MRNRLRLSRSKPRTGRGPAPRVRPQLLTLEDRTLMSVDLWNAFPGAATGAQPPDTTGAAGPDYVLEAINLTTAWYDKSGTQIYSRSLNNVFAAAGLTSIQSLSDPVAMYDEFTGQFVVGALDYNQTGHLSRFDLAISNDEDPRDGFYGQRYNMDDGTGGFDFADYPKAGYNQDAYVFSFNMFAGGSSFNHVNTLTVDKTDLTGYRVTVPGGSGNFTLAPSVMHNANPGDPMWLVETGGSGRIRVVEMTNYLSSSPNFQTFNITVPAYSSEPAPFQPGDTTRGTVTTFDTRIINASYNSGLLVAGHTVAGTGRAQARWYEIDVVDFDTPTLVQEGNVDQGAGVSTFFPSLDINYEGDIGMTFMESSASEYVSMYVTGQSIYNADYGTGVMEPPALAMAGTGRYTSGRIGDYSGTSLDPADGYSFWSFNQFAPSARPNGSTAVAYFSVDPDATTPAPVGTGGRVLPPLSVGIEEPAGKGHGVLRVDLVPLALAAAAVSASPATRAVAEAPATPLTVRPQGAEEATLPTQPVSTPAAVVLPPATPAADLGPALLAGDSVFENFLDQ